MKQRTRLSVLWTNMIHGDLNTVRSRLRVLLEDQCQGRALWSVIWDLLNHISASGDK